MLEKNKSLNQFKLLLQLKAIRKLMVVPLSLLILSKVKDNLKRNTMITLKEEPLILSVDSLLLQFTLVELEKLMVLPLMLCKRMLKVIEELNLEAGILLNKLWIIPIKLSSKRDILERWKFNRLFLVKEEKWIVWALLGKWMITLMWTLDSKLLSMIFED